MSDKPGATLPAPEVYVLIAIWADDVWYLLLDHKNFQKIDPGDPWATAEDLSWEKFGTLTALVDATHRRGQRIVGDMSCHAY